MKHFKTRAIKPITVEAYLDKTTCDLCKQEIPDEVYSADEITIEQITGTQYPEISQGEKVSIDLCQKCFDDKLIPWFESKGGKIIVEDWCN